MAFSYFFSSVFSYQTPQCGIQSDGTGEMDWWPLPCCFCQSVLLSPSLLTHPHRHSIFRILKGLLRLSSHSNKSGPLICSSRASCCLSASFQKSHSAFSISCLASKLSADCTASHFVYPPFGNLHCSRKFCLKRRVRVEGRGGLSLARV
jgi:hypothetical protein